MTTDHALLAQLRSTFEAADPIPRDTLEMARASLSWRDPDAALAELIADSLTETTPVRSRRPDGPRLVTFEADGLTIEVEIAEYGNRRRLLGQLVPPSRAEVVVRWTNGQISVSADEIGRFSASDVPAGPVSLFCTLERSTKPVATSWMSI